MSATQVAAVMVPIKALLPWVKNPRKNDAAAVEVAKSITRFGFGAPVLARKENGEIIAGHTRVKAALRLKMTEVPVRYLDLSESEAHALALADNRLGELAEWDGAMIGDVLHDLDLAGVDVEMLGWSEAELDVLLGRDVGDVDDPFGGLPTDTPEFRSMTFTVTHEQHGVIEAALRQAIDAGPFMETGNDNRNGNALARICEAYRG